MSENELEHMTFEEIMDALEKSVSDLENGKLPLNEMTAVYENGMKLAEEASKKLADTELKVTDIKKAFEEKLGTDPESESD
jgi:exodeoxyribonuclease VII small subunit